MNAEITGELKDKIQTGKIPSKDGVKTLQYVTDAIKKYDDVPVSHKPRWMVNYQNGELEDVNHPDWMDNQIKQGLVPDGLAKQHQTDNKITQTKTKLGLIKTKTRPIMKISNMGHIKPPPSMNNCTIFFSFLISH